MTPTAAPHRPRAMHFRTLRYPKASSPKISQEEKEREVLQTCCPDAQPEGVYKLSCLLSSLGLNQADSTPSDIGMDVPAAPEPFYGLQWAVSQVASMVFPSLSSSL